MNTIYLAAAKYIVFSEFKISANYRNFKLMENFPLKYSSPLFWQPFFIHANWAEASTSTPDLMFSSRAEFIFTFTTVPCTSGDELLNST